MIAYHVTLKRTKITFLIHGWSDKALGFVHGCYPNGERDGKHIADIENFNPDEADIVHKENYSWDPDKQN